MLAYFTPILLGLFFGFALSKGGLTRYNNIAGVFRLTNLTVIQFMLTALVVAATGLYGLQLFGAVQLPPAPASYLLGNLLGGLVFGVGMSLAGYCPGTCAAGSGEGKLDYLVSGILGLIAGGVLFGFTYQAVFPPILKVANLGNTTLPLLLNVSPLLLVAIFITLVLLLFYFLERGLKRSDKLQ